MTERVNQFHARKNLTEGGTFLMFSCCSASSRLTSSIPAMLRFNTGSETGIQFPFFHGAWPNINHFRKLAWDPSPASWPRPLPMRRWKVCRLQECPLWNEAWSWVQFQIYDTVQLLTNLRAKASWGRVRKSPPLILESGSRWSSTVRKSPLVPYTVKYVAAGASEENPSAYNELLEHGKVNFGYSDTWQCMNTRFLNGCHMLACWRRDVLYPRSKFHTERRSWKEACNGR